MITILKRPLLLKYSLFVVLGFALMVFFLVIVAGFSEGETITVDDDGEGEYTKIQDAIDAATEGDEIRVWAGTYEENVVVDKTLSLIGNGSEETTIDGGGVDDVVSIEAAWCNVSGFTITKSGLSLSYAGIDISSHNNMVSNNAIVANRNDGIRLDQSDYNMFSNNNISDNWGEGVYMSQSDHNNFSNNIVSDNDDKGIFFSGHYNTFSDNNVSNNDDDGIRLVSSTYNRFSNNSVLDNRYHGIYIYTNSNYNTLSNSSISRNRRNGVYLERAYHNTLSNNSISNNSFLSNEYRDLLLKDSRYSTLSSNEIRGDGISIAGDLEHWNTHSIDSLNTVNGKPLYYYANSKDLTVPQGAGQVILANCSFMTVENQNCSNAEIGINVAFSSHITISDNSIWGSRSAGIRLYESHNCTLSGNSVSGGVDGIYLYESPDNELFGNTVTDGKRGINIRWFSHRNTLSDNKVSGNEGGILVWGDYNNFTDNSITENSDYGIKLGSGTASHCRLSGNTISNNDQGITLEGASSNENEISNGTISNNRIGIRLTDGAQDNRVRDNTISGNSEYGIDASGNDGYSIDARNNWWGDRSGPYHETGNPDGKGNEVTDDVEFDPWLKSVPFNGLYVDDDAPDGGDGSWEKPYNKIQDAIDAAEDGIIIKVWAGTYEENVVVDKTVSLIGNGSEDVIIDGGRIDSVMKITADWVNVTGFCTQNSLGGDYAGIYILSNHTMISHNRCTENYAGISLVNSGHNTIANNICESNNQYAINLRSSHNTTLINNICQDQEHDFGIRLESSYHNTLIDNTCSNNQYGIILYSSNHNTITNNTCFENSDRWQEGGCGVSIHDSSDNEVSKNIFRDNDGYGIRIEDSTEIDIFNNTLIDNLYGVGVSRSSEILVFQNIIANNSDFGIDALDNDDATVDATDNWWGHITGPYHESTNQEGKGNEVTDNVDFDPWLKKPLFEDYTPPEATIDSIIPDSPLEDEDTEFTGHGTAYDSIERYVWASDLDGELHNDTTIDFSTTALSNGSHEISLRVEDNYGIWSDPDTTTVTVNGRPRAKITECSPNTGMEGDKFSFEGEATDDGSIRRYVWSSNFDGELHNSSSESDFETTTLSNGTHEISFRVQDDLWAWSDPDTTTVTVNGRPRARMIQVTPDSAVETEEVSFKGQGTDDGTIQRYLWFSDLDGELHNSTTESDFETTTLSNGTHEISFQVQDNNGVWSEPVTTTVTVNGLPRAKITELWPNPGAEGDKFDFEGDATDDGSIERYLWLSDLDGELYNNTTPLSATGIEGLSNGSHAISYLIQDELGIWSDAATATLVVNGKPRAKITTAPEGLVLFGQNLSFEGEASDDGALETYIWRSSEDGVLYQGPSTSFSCDNLSLGTHSIFFRAVDSLGAYSDWCEVVVIVYQKPVAQIDEIEPDVILDTGSALLKGEWEGDGTIVGGVWESDIDGELGSFGNLELYLAAGGSLSQDLGDEETLSVQADYDQFPGMRTNQREVEVGSWTSTSFTEDTVLGDSILLRLWYQDQDEGYSNEPVFRFTLKCNEEVLWEEDVSLEDDANEPTQISLEKKLDQKLELAAGDILTLSIHYTGWENCEIFLGSEAHETVLIFTSSSTQLRVSELTPGSHTISFKVQDDNGAWSEPATAEILVHKKPTVEVPEFEKESVVEGTTVQFTAKAEDDNAIILYIWSSSLDGELYNGSEASFNSENLSIGKHVIYLRVQDEHGVWSQTAAETLEVKKEEKDDESFLFQNVGPLPVVAYLGLLAVVAVVLVVVMGKRGGDEEETGPRNESLSQTAPQPQQAPAVQFQQPPTAQPQQPPVPQYQQPVTPRPPQPQVPASDGFSELPNVDDDKPAPSPQPVGGNWSCSSCGKEVPGKYVFCLYCGNKK